MKCVSFLLGFASGAYVAQNYNIPQTGDLIIKLKDLEKDFSKPKK